MTMAGCRSESLSYAKGADKSRSRSTLRSTLKFRKDATVDVHKAEEYKVVDPLADKKVGAVPSYVCAQRDFAHLVANAVDARRTRGAQDEPGIRARPPRR